MNMFARAALALSALFACAVAMPAVAQTRTPASCPRADGAYIACTPVVIVDATTGLPLGAGGIPTTDPANASFSTAVGPLVAATDYGAQAFRAINVTCSASGSANLTLSSGVLPYTFASGPSYQIAFVLKSIDAVPAGCVLYGLK